MKNIFMWLMIVVFLILLPSLALMSCSDDDSSTVDADDNDDDDNDDDDNDDNDNDDDDDDNNDDDNDNNDDNDNDNDNDNDDNDDNDDDNDTVLPDMEFRFSPETMDCFGLSDLLVIEVQIRSLIGEITLGGFQLEFTYNNDESTGVQLVFIDTENFIPLTDMSVDWTDAENDGSASIFRGVNVAGGEAGFRLQISGKLSQIL